MDKPNDDIHYDPQSTEKNDFQELTDMDYQILLTERSYTYWAVIDNTINDKLKVTRTK